jgi:hypothetical protein
MKNPVDAGFWSAQTKERVNGEHKLQPKPARQSPTPAATWGRQPTLVAAGGQKHTCHVGNNQSKQLGKDVLNSVWPGLERAVTSPTDRTARTIQISLAACSLPCREPHLPFQF